MVLALASNHNLKGSRQNLKSICMVDSVTSFDLWNQMQFVDLTTAWQFWLDFQQEKGVWNTRLK